MIEIAHRYGARVLVDGAQSIAHMGLDVQLLDCDFFVFSGHKIFAPTGIGVVFGKGDILDHTPPWQGGGSMILDVTFEKTVYNVPPARFEAGTGNIADAVGLGAALDYLEQIGMENIARYEHDLLAYATKGLLSVPGLHLIGTAREKASVLSFVLDGFRTEDVGKALNQEGIAVRAGHHCAQPILRRFGPSRPQSARRWRSPTPAKTVDALVAALLRIRRTQPVDSRLRVQDETGNRACFMSTIAIDIIVLSKTTGGGGLRVATLVTVPLKNAPSPSSAEALPEQPWRHSWSDAPIHPFPSS
jgi:cysteine desulfurase/selenocysteine lyase